MKIQRAFTSSMKLISPKDKSKLGFDKLDDALVLFDKMLVTFNTLIRGFVSQDEPVEAQFLFTNLVRFKDVQPNVVTYTVIIDGFCKRGHTSMAVRLLRCSDIWGRKVVSPIQELITQLLTVYVNID